MSAIRGAIGDQRQELGGQAGGCLCVARRLAWAAARAAIALLSPEPEERPALLQRGGIVSEWMKTGRTQGQNGDVEN